MSNANLQQVREDVSAAKSELKALAAVVENEAREFTQDEFARWDSLEETVNKGEAKLATLERTEKAKDKFTRSRSEVFGAPTIKVSRKASRHDVDNALRAWMFHGHQRVHVKDEWKRSADLVECNWEQKEFFCRSQETDTTNHTGEDLLNGSMFQSFIEAKNWEGSILQYCDVTYSPLEDLNQPIHIAYGDDTESYGVYKKQNVALVNQGLTNDKVNLTGHMVTTSIQPVSIGFLLNRNLNVLDYLNRSIGARLRRTILRDIMIGDGNQKPLGLFHENSNVAVGANALTHGITPQNIRDLEYSVNRAYRESPNCAFVTHDSTAYSLEDTLVDGNDNPVWANNMQAKASDRMRGFPLVISNWMDEMECDGSGPVQKNNVMAFGDFSHHKVRFCGGPNFVRDDSRLVDSLSVFFAGWQIVDSRYLNPGNDPIATLATGFISGDPGCNA